MDSFQLKMHLQRRASTGLLLTLAAALLSSVTVQAVPAPEIALSPPGVVAFQAESGNSWQFDLQIPDFELVTSQDELGPCQLIKIAGFAPSGRPGSPQVPTKGVLVGIPLGAELEIGGITAEPATLPGRYRLCPVSSPAVTIDPLTGEIRSEEARARPAPATYAHPGFQPESPARLGEIGFIRSQRVAQVLFQPFQYNPTTGQLRYYRHIRLQLRFDPATDLRPAGQAPVAEGAFEALLKDSLVNYEMARSWRSRPQVDQDETVNARPVALQSPAGVPSGFKFKVSQDGLYKVTYEALVAAGGNFSGIDPQTFQVIHNQQEVDVLVVGESDASFDPGDYILFYGQAIQSKYTKHNVYFLQWGLTTGQRMNILDGTVSGSGSTPTEFLASRHIETNAGYLSNYPSGPDNDVWYWNALYGSGGLTVRNYTTSLNNISAGSSDARLRGLLRSYSASPQHHTRIYINNNLVHDQFWSEGAQLLFDVTFPQSYLQNGVNTIKLEAPLDSGITLDIVLINWFELEYWDQYTAESNLLFFNGVPASVLAYQVNGFTSNLIEAYDISDPNHPVKIVNGTVSGSPGSYTLSFDHDITGAHNYLALAESARLAPEGIAPEYPSNWESPANGANYVVISHKDFLSAIAPLVAHRAAQGYTTALIDVEDIYDEFNGGVTSPVAIRNFLAYAVSWWNPAPEFVLLVGDGNYDPLNFLGTSPASFIPPYLEQVDPWIGETASENHFTLVSGNDILPDLYLGRFPVSTAAQVTAIVDKILAYESALTAATWNKQTLFVADDTDGGGFFNVYSDNIANNFTPATYLAQKVYYGDNYTSIPAAQAAILAAINEGRLIVNYIGHGSVQYWASEQLLGINSISSLTNTGKYPFMVPMTCLEGSFHYPPLGSNQMVSLAETLLRADSKGSIGSWSPTGYGVASGHDYLNQGLFTALFKDNLTQIGPATTAAKLHLFSSTRDHDDLISTYALFADPAMRLQIYQWHYLPILPNLPGSQ